MCHYKHLINTITHGSYTLQWPYYIDSSVLYNGIITVELLALLSYSVEPGGVCSTV